MTQVFTVTNATLNGRTGAWDLRIADGVVSAISPHGAISTEASQLLDAHGGLVSRSFVEPHIHPDKSYSLSDPPEGIEPAELARLDGFTRAARIKAGFSVENVERRARRAFELALQNGVTRLRATADVDTIAGLRGFEGLHRARESMRGLMDIDLVAFPQEGLQRDPGALALLRAALESGADAIGGWPNVEVDPESAHAHVNTVFDLAEEFDVDVDIHADCFLDPAERALEYIAQETIRRGYHGRVLASHCAALELYRDEDAARVIRLVAEAGITVAVIPLNLSDGGGRGLSRPQELLAAGATVVAGSDNLNDGWYPLGTLNPLDRATMTFLGGSFHREEDVDAVWNMVTDDAWRALGGAGGDIVVGAQADLVVIDAATRAAALENPLTGITTVHRGRIVAQRAVTEHWNAPLGGEL